MEECLCDFQTVPVGHPLDRNRSPFVQILICPPAAQDGPSFGAILDHDPEPILVFQVVGITEAEYRFAWKHDPERLWEKLGGEAMIREIDQEQADPTV